MPSANQNRKHVRLSLPVNKLRWVSGV